MMLYILELHFQMKVSGLREKENISHWLKNILNDASFGTYSFYKLIFFLNLFFGGSRRILMAYVYQHVQRYKKNHSESREKSFLTKQNSFLKMQLTLNPSVPQAYRKYFTSGKTSLFIFSAGRLCCPQGIATQKDSNFRSPSLCLCGDVCLHSHHLCVGQWKCYTDISRSLIHVHKETVRPTCNLCQTYCIYVSIESDVLTDHYAH